MDKMQTQEMISALMDGQLRGEGFARGVELAVNDSAAQDAWQTYHLIGDVLRSGTHATATSPSVFLKRLQVRLREERLLPEAERLSVPAVAPVEVVAKRSASNDGNFRWKFVAGFASMAAVAAIGWTVVGKLEPVPQAQVAAVPAGNMVASSERGPMIRDPRIDEFLAAHRQLGGPSALPMPAGFLRNATFEGPAR